MPFPNYVPPENPQRLGKIIMFYRFLNVVRDANDSLGCWIILTPTGEFESVPYLTDEDIHDDNELFEQAVHKRLFNPLSGYLGPQAAEAVDSIRPIFISFFEIWRRYRRIQLQQKNRKNKQLLSLIDS